MGGEAIAWLKIGAAVRMTLVIGTGENRAPPPLTGPGLLND